MIHAKLRSTTPEEHRSSAAEDDEAGHGRQAADDLDGDLGLVLRPGHQFSGVATVGEDALDEAEAARRASQHPLCALAVLHIGPADRDDQQSSVSVGEAAKRCFAALAPVDVLSGVVALASPF